jgi:hypothetical protein
MGCRLHCRSSGFTTSASRTEIGRCEKGLARAEDLHGIGEGRSRVAEELVPGCCKLVSHHLPPCVSTFKFIDREACRRMMLGPLEARLDGSREDYSGCDFVVNATFCSTIGPPILRQCLQSFCIEYLLMLQVIQNKRPRRYRIMATYTRDQKRCASEDGLLSAWSSDMLHQVRTACRPNPDARSYCRSKSIQFPIHPLDCQCLTCCSVPMQTKSLLPWSRAAILYSMPQTWKPKHLDYWIECSRSFKPKQGQHTL